MSDMQISEIIHALDLLGTVHRNKTKSKPNAAILKVRDLIAQGSGLTLSEWIKQNQSLALSNSRTKIYIDQNELQEILDSAFAESS